MRRGRERVHLEGEMETGLLCVRKRERERGGERVRERKRTIE